MHHPTDIIFSQILTIGIQGPQVDVMLIRLVDMSFSEMFSDPHYRYTMPSGGSHVDQIGGHGF